MKRLIPILIFLVGWSGSPTAKTLQDYLNDVRYEVVGDSGLTDDPISDAMITDWIEDARHIIAGITGCLQKDTTIATVDGQVQYSLPSDFLKIKGVITPPMQSSSDLAGSITGATERSPADVGEKHFGAGLPEEWFQWGTDTAKLYINPAPLGIYDVTVFYYAEPASLDSAAAVCDLPRTYQAIVPLYAIGRAYGKMGQQEYKNKEIEWFNAFWQALMQTVTERRTEAPGE
jgi:hypothetical protein